MTTKNKIEALADLDRKHAEAREKLEREYTARDSLGVNVDGFEPPSVFVHRLYGTEGSIHFKRCEYASIAKGKGPTPALLRDLLAAHSPLPMVRFEDGCVSYRLESSLKEKERERGRVIPIEPVSFRVELNSFDQRVTAEWCAMLGDAPWYFQVSFPLYGHKRKLGVPDASAEHDRHGRITKIERATWRNGPPGLQVNRYRSGSFDTFPSLVLWWHRADAGIDIPALLESE